MSLITWNDNIAVGIGSIDAQHKRFIELLNGMYEAMAAGKAKDVLNKILSEVVTYTKTHFATEESLMIAKGYPDYAKHKAEHDAFIKKIADMQAKQGSGSTIVSIELMTSLRSWLIDHIQKVDRLYAPHLKSKGVV